MVAEATDVHTGGGHALLYFDSAPQEWSGLHFSPGKPLPRDPPRLPIGGVEQRHLPRSNLAPRTRLPVAVPGLRFPKTGLAGAKAWARVRNLNRLVRFHPARIPYIPGVPLQLVPFDSDLHAV